MSGKIVIFNHPLMSHKLSIIRNEKTNTKDFRETVSEIANLMAYEATRNIPVKEVEVQTIETPVTTPKKNEYFVSPILGRQEMVESNTTATNQRSGTKRYNDYRKKTDEPKEKVEKDYNEYGVYNTEQYLENVKSAKNKHFALKRQNKNI